jgi:hypothetical protein
MKKRGISNVGWTFIVIGFSSFVLLSLYVNFLESNTQSSSATGLAANGGIIGSNPASPSNVDPETINYCISARKNRIFTCTENLDYCIWWCTYLPSSCENQCQNNFATCTFDARNTYNACVNGDIAIPV